ncbi:DUF4386 domain-containing protein [Amycolatopsis sp. CA-230715]|uniref:DUF4386 domain-containing protein n=1 Tax=Amycolatopsis sp. CA-230715 TaxID=2745196 RepID=UPI001C011B78|nr:DUF4386 domain-containing protein [Amycolatopsis sp. CA-230715]QWF79071.1 hypothetical protein HUW46_02478 [Amycolatopsis sp. CA-230715]
MTTKQQSVAHAGPPLLVPGLVFAVFTVLTGVLGASGPRPDTPVADVAAYYAGHHTTVVIWAALLFGSAIPLAIWSATAYRRLRQLGVAAPGTAIGLAGGLLASASLAFSGLTLWTMGEVADVHEPGVVHALQTLSFVTGGVGFVVPLALLIAGVCVPSLFVPLLPRPLAWSGLGVAALGVLATVSLLVPALAPLLPVGRFGGGVLWLLAASALLPRDA